MTAQGLRGRDLGLALLICLCWAFNFLTSAHALQEIPPFLFTARRMGMVLLLLAAFMRVPPRSQWLRLAGVALFTGVIATVVFFHATGLVRNQPAALGAVEAMQAAELLFTSALGVLFLGEAIPRGWAALGALLVIAGIIALGVLVGRDAARDRRKQQALRSDRGA